jgi:hypothetical protein
MATTTTATTHRSVWRVRLAHCGGAGTTS